MSGPSRQADDLFRPTRTATGARLVAAVILGPFSWLVACLIVAWLLDETDVIEAFLFITLFSFLVGVVVLLLMRAGRERERRRYDVG